MDENLNNTPSLQPTEPQADNTDNTEPGTKSSKKHKGISTVTLVAIMVVAVIATALITFSMTREAVSDQYRAYYSELLQSNQLTPFLQKFKTVEEFVGSSFIKDYDLSKAEDAALYAFFSALGDDYTFYMDKAEYDATMTDSAGIVAGIGVRAVTDPDTGHICIMTVMPDSPALAAGIKPLDRIVKVFDTEVNADSYSECLDLIRGETGTDVKLTIKRGEETFEVTCTRQKVNNITVEYRKLDGDIALIKVTEFVSTTPAQFKAAMQKAQDEGCKSYIFDMRNNPGGSLGAIEEVLDYLLPEGPIINIVYADGETEVFNSDANEFKAPMVVLCNGSTASAGELFTAALRDYKKATVIGQTTFGKGTMQTIKQLPDGSGFRMSIAYYNPPCNISYDGTGITPDVVIELSEEQQKYFYFLDDDEDPQLQAAIAELSK